MLCCSRKAKGLDNRKQNRTRANDITLLIQTSQRLLIIPFPMLFARKEGFAPTFNLADVVCALLIRNSSSDVVVHREQRQGGCRPKKGGQAADRRGVPDGCEMRRRFTYKKRNRVRKSRAHQAKTKERNGPVEYRYLPKSRTIQSLMSTPSGSKPFHLGSMDASEKSASSHVGVNGR